MTANTKSALLLGGALVTGVLLGALIVGAFVAHRVDRMDRLRQPARLAQFLERTIEPTSPAQRDSIRTVVRYRARQAAYILRQTRRDLEAVRDSLRADLRPLLTDDQLARLQERTRMRPLGPPPPFLRGGPFDGPAFRDGPRRPPPRRFAPPDSAPEGP